MRFLRVANYVAALSVAAMALTTFYACSDSDDDNDNDGEVIQEPLSFASESSFSLYSGETAEILLSGASKPTFTSADDFFASVSKQGVVTAKHVGSTTVAISDKGRDLTADVEVKAKYTLPYVEHWRSDIPFGSPLATAESVLGALGEWDDDWSSTGDEHYCYWNPTDDVSLILTYNKAGNLIYYCAMIRETAIPADLENALKERFEGPQKVGDATRYTFTPAGQDAVTLSLESLEKGWLSCIYSPSGK